MYKEAFLIIIYIFSYIFITDLLMNLFYRKVKSVSLKGNPFLRVFYNTLLFSLLLVSLIAIFATKGKTIFILCVPALFLLIKQYLQKPAEIANVNQNETKPLILWSYVFVIISFITVFSFYLTIKFSIRNDTIFYSKIAENLIDLGIENGFHQYNKENSILVGCQPYHYFELWFGSIVFKLNERLHFLNSSNYITYVYFVFNLFRVLTLIGLFGLLNKFVKINVFYFLVGFSIFIVDISAFFHWWNQSFIAESNYYRRPNFIFYYVFLIPLIDSLLNKKRIPFLLWSAIFIIASITALPAVSLCAFLLLALEYYKNKEDRKNIIKNAALFLVFLLCIPVFYKIFGMAREAAPIENYSLTQIIHETSSIWKACVFMFVVLSIKINLLILFAWLLSKTKWIKVIDTNNKFQILLLYLFLINLAGIGLFQLIPYLDNMYQFAFIGYCFTFLILTFIIILILSQANKFQKIFLFLIYCLLFTYTIKRNVDSEILSLDKNDWTISLEKNYLLQHKLSPDYVDILEKNARELSGKKGASIIFGDDSGTEFSGLRHSATYQLGNYLTVYNNHVNLPLLSDPETLYPDTDKSSKAYYKAYNFNELTLFYKNYDYKVNYKENLNRYIKQHDIKYLFASSSFNPYIYLDSIKISSVSREKNKGHQLIILK